MKLNTIPKCDFCHSDLPLDFYQPRNSKRGMHVYVCSKCGLIQSKSTKAYESRPEPSMSCDADRASIKYTKDLVLRPHLKLLESWVDLKSLENVLDVGSNRGAFLKEIININSSVKLTAVETDPDLIGKYSKHPQVSALNQRLESTSLKSEHYDLIYCAHTLEHFDSASSMLLKLQDAARPGGLLFYAVPNALFLSDDTFEEIFIDPHTYHFHAGVLETYFKAQALEVLFNSSSDSFELNYLLRKPVQPVSRPPLALFSRSNVEKSISFLNSYVGALARNRRRLKIAGAKINALSASNKVVFWGAGRIFDGLVKLGGLDTSKIQLLVDKYLFRYMSSVHGVDIRAPEAVLDFPLDTIIIVASREYESEITKEAMEMGFFNIFGYSQFMSEYTADPLTN